MIIRYCFLLLIMATRFCLAQDLAVKANVNYKFRQAFDKPKGNGPNQAQWLKVFLDVHGKKCKQFHISRSKDGNFYLVACTQDNNVWRWNERTGRWLDSGRGQEIRVTPDGIVWVCRDGKIFRCKQSYFAEKVSTDDWILFVDQIGDKRVAHFNVNQDKRSNLYLAARTENKKSYRYSVPKKRWLYSGGMSHKLSIGSQGQYWCADAGLWWRWKPDFYEEDVSYARKGAPYPWVKGTKINNEKIVDVGVDGNIQLFVCASTDKYRQWRLDKSDTNKWLPAGLGEQGCVTVQGEYWSLDKGTIWRWVDGSLFVPGQKDYIHNERAHKRAVEYHNQWIFKQADEGTLLIKIRGRESALIALSTEPKNVDGNMYLIELGAEKNTKTIIRKGMKARVVHTQDDTKSLLDGGLPGPGFKWQAYWLQFKDGKITLGRGPVVGKSQFLSWQDTDKPIRGINFVGLGGGAKASVDFADITFDASSKEKAATTKLPIFKRVLSGIQKAIGIKPKKEDKPKAVQIRVKEKIQHDKVSKTLEVPQAAKSTKVVKPSNGLVETKNSRARAQIEKKKKPSLTFEQAAVRQSPSTRKVNPNRQPNRRPRQQVGEFRGLSDAIKKEYKTKLAKLRKQRNKFRRRARRAQRRSIKQRWNARVKEIQRQINEVKLERFKERLKHASGGNSRKRIIRKIKQLEEKIAKAKK